MNHFHNIAALAIGICAVSAAQIASAATVRDEVTQFSVDAPTDAKIDRQQNDKGRLVSVLFRDVSRQQVVHVQAVQANGGGLEQPSMNEFKEMVRGMSATIGKPPTIQPHTVEYRGITLYLVSHSGVGPGGGQTITAIVAFEQDLTSRRVLNMELVTPGTKEPTDSELVDRMEGLQYRPFFH